MSTETVRELLELAARAAGISITWVDSFDAGHDTPNIIPLPPESCHFVLSDEEDCAGEWNPLADDGDGARLEAALGLDVTWTAAEDAVCVERYRDGEQGCYATELVAAHSGDKQAARRMATLRCAARVGKAIAARQEG